MNEDEISKYIQYQETSQINSHLSTTTSNTVPFVDPAPFQMLNRVKSAPSVIESSIPTNDPPDLPTRRESIAVSAQMPLTTPITPNSAHPIHPFGAIRIQGMAPRSAPVMSIPGRTSSVLEAIEERKLQRLQKNREAAKESRRKKKQYILELESRVEALTHENQDLKNQLNDCKEKLRKLQEFSENVDTNAGNADRDDDELDISQFIRSGSD